MENLNNILEDFYDIDENKNEEADEQQRFRVTDLSSADWVLKQLKYKKSDFEEQLAYIEQEEKRLKEYKTKVQAKYEEDKAYFEHLLQEFVDKRLEDDPKFKLKTLSGGANYGKELEKWDWKDEDITINALKNAGHNKFIKVTVTEKLDKNELKKYLTIAGDNVVDENGEIIDGIEIIRYRNFNIKY